MQARGAIHLFFAADHRRLDGLLRRSVARKDAIDLELFEAFRRGLLRHIGMEEKLLFPAVRNARRGEPLEIAARLRVDHGAFAALLVPTPTRAWVALILSLLIPHNLREEEPGGIYDASDTALGPAAAAGLLADLEAFPEPPLKAHNDTPEVIRHLESALALARAQWGPSKGTKGGR